MIMSSSLGASNEAARLERLDAKRVTSASTATDVREDRLLADAGGGDGVLVVLEPEGPDRLAHPSTDHAAPVPVANDA
jgi:hypothetical protein